MNPALPRLLLVEDDPVSAAFLADAATALPASVDRAGSIADALACSEHAQHDLLLIDANLPDGTGTALLQALQARGRQPRAIAHTADASASLRDALLAAGFLDVLRKPLATAELHAALRRQLGQPATTTVWDDAAALASLGGVQAHVDALRGLFLQELPEQRTRIREAFAAGNGEAMRADLHRLAASCGFVGAAGLGQAVRRLQAAPAEPAALAALLSEAEALLATTRRP